VKLDYSEKVLTYWSRKYFEREVAEKKSFYDFVQEYQKDPRSFRLSATQVPAIKKYLKKEVLHMKTGELIKTADLAAVLDMDKINLEYNLMGCYSLATSEIHMDDQEIIDTYGNLVEIEEQFHVMKSTLDTRPIYVRTREHIMAHLTICTMALIITRLIQKQLKAKHPELVNDKLLYCNVLSADRIQAALNKLKIEKLGDTYYRFCDIDDPDLALILDSFGISIPKKCFKIGEIRQLKAKMKMSM
jgi:transposase